MAVRSRKRWLPLVIGVITAGIFLAGFGYWRYSATQRWNVILITLDTTRADHLGCYGYNKVETPTIDAVAKSGVVFERAYTTVPLTLPSHASMLTGLNPYEHTLFANTAGTLPDNIPTLAEALSKNGYSTAAFLSAFVLHQRFGLFRGFDKYDDDVAAPSKLEPIGQRRSADQVTDRALQWLKFRDSKPFFCWIHYFDPHVDYHDHQEVFGKKFAQNPYDAEISYVDLHLKRVLDYLEAQRLKERTLVIIVGDHGEGLCEHRERFHGLLLYDSTLRVPFIVSAPSKAKANLRVNDPVSVIDVTPTVLDYLGLPCPKPISGRSLRPFLKGQTLPSRACYGVAKQGYIDEGWAPLTCLVSDNWKYIRTTKPELYDLIGDPGEKTNLAETHPEMVQQFEQQLEDMETSGAHFESQGVSLSEREQKNLDDLGYIGGSDSAKNSSAELSDIKDHLEELEAFETAHDLSIHGKMDEAIVGLYEVIGKSPHYVKPRIMLGQLLVARGKIDEAELQFMAILDQNPKNIAAHANMGTLMLERKQYEAALEHTLRALEVNPLSARLHLEAGKALRELGRTSEAAPHFQTADQLMHPDKSKKPGSKQR